MVSLLSFFQSKKKSKRSPSSPTSPTSSSSTRFPAPSMTTSSPLPQNNQRPTLQGPSASSSSSTSRPRPAGRFLSLRHKSSNGRPSAHDLSLSSRRASSELSRKRSQVKGASSRTDAHGQGQGLTSASTTILPKLDLGFEVSTAGGNDSANGPGRSNELGLLGIGEKVDLSRDEVDILDRLELSVEDVKLAWTIFGQALRESDLNTVGLMLPHRLDSDRLTELYLLSIYALTINPALLSSFPTIAAQFAQPSFDPSKVWTERLKVIARDTERPSDLAEVLKYILRRLHTFPTPSSTSNKPLIDSTSYVAFVQAENAASYPWEAYNTLLVPKLQPGVPRYLDEIFEVWSAIAAHADENTMTAGRLAYLLGWWVLRSGVSKVAEWEKFYKDWQVAGRRIEHLLFAWIRYQSTRMQIPTRLLEIVDNYPFGESTASSERLPVPPPSSFPRQTLHVTLSSTVPPIGLFRSPEELLKSAVSAKQDEDASLPHWASLKRAASDDQVDLAAIIAEDSLAFLRKTAQASAQTPPSTPSLSAASPRTPINTNDGPLYRPFSTVSGGRSSPRTRAFSQDAIASPPPGSSSHNPSAGDMSDSKPYKEVKKQSSLSILPNGGGGGSIWDDFSKSGFGDSPNTVGELGLAFSPQSNSAPLSPAGSNVNLSSGSRRPAVKKRTTFQESSKAVAAEYTILQEDVIEIDDTFLSFVEDAQIDSRCVLDWPPFSLVRLASRISSDTADHRRIEWLLVTVVHRPPPPPPEPEVVEPDVQNRPTSPASSKQGTPRGFRNIADSFKRSSSFQSHMGLRRSFFGTSGFSLSRHVPDDLATLPESQSGENCELRAPPSAQSLTPTEYTLGEMGEIVKIPSAAEKTERSRAAFETVLANLSKEEDEVTIKGGEKAIPGLCTETSAKDWRYNGEGAEHIVFSYRGEEPSHIGQVLRIKKSTLALAPQSPVDLKPVHAVWRDKLLPKLVSPDLLLHSNTIDLEQSWAKELLGAAESVRPEKRREGAGKGLADLVASDIQALVMEDTTINEKGSDKVTLAVEIKPKWGFLPSAEWISPSEAVPIKSQNCRFCLHSHLRSEAPDSEKKYCPLDLYSGDEMKMNHAIEQLWGMWVDSGGKGNNWRLFIDGDRIKPDQIDAIPAFAGDGSPTAITASLVIPALRSSNALGQLQSLQSTLDPTDISDLAARFTASYPDASLFDSFHLPNPTVAELEEFVHVYLSSPQAGKEKADMWSLRQRLIAYSLSAIFKDCSVFVKVTLTKLDSGDWEAVKGSEKVKIVDLDLKPIQNMGRWYERDSEIWRHWLKTKSSATTTSDGPAVGNDDDHLRQQAAQPTTTENDRLATHEPVRQKTISGLTVPTSSEGAEDGASTRAAFVPTPDRTRASTPLASAVPGTIAITDTPHTAPEEAEVKVSEEARSAGEIVASNASASNTETAHVFPPSTETTSVDNAAAILIAPIAPVIQDANAAPVVSNTADVETRQRTESTATSVSDQPARKERSLAPSPSPSVGYRELAVAMEAGDETSSAVKTDGQGAGSETPNDVSQIGADTKKEPAEAEAGHDVMENHQPVDEVHGPVIDASGVKGEQETIPVSQYSATPSASHKGDEPSAADDIKRSAEQDEVLTGGATSPAPAEGDAFFTPTETPLWDLHEPIIALAKTLPSIPNDSLPSQVEITEHKGEPQAFEEEIASAGEITGAPKLRIISIEDATPKHESAITYDNDSVDGGPVPQDHYIDKATTEDPFTVKAAGEVEAITSARSVFPLEPVEDQAPNPDGPSNVEAESHSRSAAPTDEDLAPSGSSAESEGSISQAGEGVPPPPTLDDSASSDLAGKTLDTPPAAGSNPQWLSAQALQLGEPIDIDHTTDRSTISAGNASSLPTLAIASKEGSKLSSEPARADFQDNVLPMHSDSAKAEPSANHSVVEPDDAETAQEHLDIPYHDLETISEGGESSIPTATEMSRDNTDDAVPAQSEVDQGSNAGEQWVEDVDGGLEETPRVVKRDNLPADGQGEESESVHVSQLPSGAVPEIPANTVSSSGLADIAHTPRAAPSREATVPAAYGKENFEEPTAAAQHLGPKDIDNSVPVSAPKKVSPDRADYESHTPKIDLVAQVEAEQEPKKDLSPQAAGVTEIADLEGAPAALEATKQTEPVTTALDHEEVAVVPEHDKVTEDKFATGPIIEESSETSVHESGPATDVPLDVGHTQHHATDVLNTSQEEDVENSDDPSDPGNVPKISKPVHELLPALPSETNTMEEFSGGDAQDDKQGKGSFTGDHTATTESKSVSDPVTEALATNDISAHVPGTTPDGSPKVNAIAPTTAEYVLPASTAPVDGDNPPYEAPTSAQTPPVTESETPVSPSATELTATDDAHEKVI
ncbi:hypothetical protein I316_07926 [Kwoniella heveanensis BCC8398]|uniref:Inositol-pentakisphosphate 2-kinase n=1 Tax=Kwoniella heveanensis BCC8398 TaxID=1296120 RepID=A0A1B9GHB6_9TREE|nr:hypothetical protein I316_07926 [Kwoniella heveanensis BCC8398]